MKDLALTHAFASLGSNKDVHGPGMIKHVFVLAGV